MHLALGYLCHTLSVISNRLFFNRPWFIYNTEWCRLLFLQFLWTFLWMHLVGYLCDTLLILSKHGVWQQLSRLSLLSCFLSSGVSTSGSLSSPVLVKLYFPCLFMLILYGLQFIAMLIVPCILLSADGSFPWCSEFVSVLSFCQGWQKLFDGILFLHVAVVKKFLLEFWFPLISIFVSNIKFLSRVEGLFLYIMHIIIHTIQDAVAIPKYATCQICGGCRLSRKFPEYVFAVEIIHHWIHERKTYFIYWCTRMHVCWWKPRCSVIISIRIRLGCRLWCTVVFICEIDLDLAVSIFYLLYVKFFSLLMHTIQDKVGIANCGTWMWVQCLRHILMAAFIFILNLVMNGFSHHFLTYLIFTKIWCYVISFSSLYDIYLSLSYCGTLPVRYLALCSLFSILSMRYVCVVFGWTLPVTYIHWLCCFFSIFSMRYHCLVFSCGTLAWDTCHCAASFPSSLSDTIVLLSVVELCLWDTWPCAASFPSSLSDTIVLLSVVELCLWDTWPCAVYFRSSLCDIFV